MRTVDRFGARLVAPANSAFTAAVSARRHLLALLLVPLMSLGLAGCDSGHAAVRGGNPQRGIRLIERDGCGTCHVIPGIDGADGVVGPPLTGVGRRIYLAGVLRNTPNNMTEWLVHPQAVIPGNAMPNMGLSDRQARDIAAYLYTLR